MPGRAARFIVCLAIVCLGWIEPSQGAEPRTEHTYQLAQGEAFPTATVADVAWLSGSWRGTAFGKGFEEVWNPPSAGSMVGLFKLIDNDNVDLYEIMLISVVDGRLGLRVKHFTQDFVAWEDKSESVHFKLVAIEENAVHFSGISFYRRGPDRLDGYIVMRTADGIREEHLVYQRRP